ncbi:MAG TPA: DUF4214 domain-containing protein [Pyrinomonadaceae bacterium]|jgi:hypothetical protein|nr:DUF4214 domain-containing protein [Pyrinomonadaceae bacterium]
MMKIGISFLAIALLSVTALAQSPPTLRIVTETPGLPSELYYGNIKVKPLRLRPGTNQVITINDIDFFVAQQYIDFLGRFPDSTGFANWNATLNGCPNGGYGEFDNPGCDRVHVSAGFYQSYEFQGRGYWAYRFYDAALGRRPLYAEFVPDMIRIGGSQSPDQEAASKIVYINDFVQKPEFKSLYDALNNSQYVDKLEQTAGVTLTNKAALISALDGNQKTRAEVLRDVIESQVVFDKFFNRGFVSMQYFGYLRRDPDTIGFQNWVNTLNADPSNFRHMIFGFIYSTEYLTRF